MTLFSKIMLSITLLFTTTFANAVSSDNETEMTAFQLYQQLNLQNEANGQPFMKVLSQFVQATADAGRCTGSWDCKWPTTDCVNNRCVKSNGDSGECSGSWDCKWPTTQCERGRCVKSDGDGGECTGSWNCKWPYSECKNGFCERP